MYREYIIQQTKFANDKFIEMCNRKGIDYRVNKPYINLSEYGTIIVGIKKTFVT